jgi:hypothetical protein
MHKILVKETHGRKSLGRVSCGFYKIGFCRNGKPTFGNKSFPKINSDNGVRLLTMPYPKI